MIQNVFDSDQGCAGSYEIVINSITRIVMFIVQLQQKFIVICKCLINTVSLIQKFSWMDMLKLQKVITDLIKCLQDADVLIFFIYFTRHCNFQIIKNVCYLLNMCVINTHSSMSCKHISIFLSYSCCEPETIMILLTPSSGTYLFLNLIS